MSVLFDLLADFWGDIADWLIERFTGKQRRRPPKSSPSKIGQIRKPGIHAYWCGCRVFIFLFFKISCFGFLTASVRFDRCNQSAFPAPCCFHRSASASRRWMICSSPCRVV